MPQSVWRRVRARVHLSLTPVELSDPIRSATRKAFSSLLMRYNADLGGAVVAHIAPVTLCSAPVFVGASPCAHVAAIATLLVFAPAKGSELLGVVTHVGPDHVGLSVFAAFHAVLPIHALRDVYSYKSYMGDSKIVRKWTSADGANDITIGRQLRFLVTELKPSHTGLFHIVASLDPTHRFNQTNQYSLGVLPREKEIMLASKTIADGENNLQQLPQAADFQVARRASAAHRRESMTGDDLLRADENGLGNALFSTPTPVSALKTEKQPRRHSESRSVTFHRSTANETSPDGQRKSENRNAALEQRTDNTSTLSPMQTHAPNASHATSDAINSVSLRSIDFEASPFGKQEAIEWVEHERIAPEHSSAQNGDTTLSSEANQIESTFAGTNSQQIKVKADEAQLGVPEAKKEATIIQNEYVTAGDHMRSEQNRGVSSHPGETSLKHHKIAASLIKGRGDSRDGPAHRLTTAKSNIKHGASFGAHAEEQGRDTGGISKEDGHGNAMQADANQDLAASGKNMYKSEERTSLAGGRRREKEEDKVASVNEVHEVVLLPNQMSNVNDGNSGKIEEGVSKSTSTHDSKGDVKKKKKRGETESSRSGESLKKGKKKRKGEVERSEKKEKRRKKRRRESSDTLLKDNGETQNDEKAKIKTEGHRLSDSENVDDKKVSKEGGSAVGETAIVDASKRMKQEDRNETADSHSKKKRRKKKEKQVVVDCSGSQSKEGVEKKSGADERAEDSGQVSSGLKGSQSEDSKRGSSTQKKQKKRRKLKEEEKFIGKGTQTSEIGMDPDNNDKSGNDASSKLGKEEEEECEGRLVVKGVKSGLGFRDSSGLSRMPESVKFESKAEEASEVGLVQTQAEEALRGSEGSRKKSKHKTKRRRSSQGSEVDSGTKADSGRRKAKKKRRMSEAVEIERLRSQGGEA